MSAFKPTSMSKISKGAVYSDVHTFSRCNKCNHKFATINNERPPCPECNGKGKPKESKE